MNRLVLTPDGWRNWTLVEDFKEEVEVPEKGLVEIIVPKGFRTDLASVPRPFWSIIPPMGRYSQAAVIHDYLCTNRQFPSNVTHKIFYDLMLKYDTYPRKAKLMYTAVKWFGPKWELP